MAPASTSFVLGYHGCDRTVAERVLSGTVRAVFLEGDRLYKNAGFAAKSHIQICVRNTASVKGYFRPLDENGRSASFT